MNHFDAPAAHPAVAADTELAPARTPAPARAPKVRLITSQALFGDFPEVQIEHGEAVYRLRQTSLGKLILTK